MSFFGMTSGKEIFPLRTCLCTKLTWLKSKALGAQHPRTRDSARKCCKEPMNLFIDVGGYVYILIYFMFPTKGCPQQS